MENLVKYFLLFSNLLYTAAYVVAWKRIDLFEAWGFNSPFSLHLTTVVPVILVMFLAQLGVIFYFVGTGVWIKDRAYDIARSDKKRAEDIFEQFKKANKLKPFAFPFATFAIFFGILTFVLGGAKQVGAISAWVHPTLATALLIVLWLGFPVISRMIFHNFEILDDVSALYEGSFEKSAVEEKA